MWMWMIIEEAKLKVARVVADGLERNRLHREGGWTRTEIAAKYTSPARPVSINNTISFMI